MSCQVRDVGSGAFGVCKLMKNTRTGEMVAVKLMERGDKVGAALAAAQSCPRHRPPYPVMDRARRNGCFALLQIDINVEREVLNHKQLVHPNVVQFKEVRMYAYYCHCYCRRHRHTPHELISCWG